MKKRLVALIMVMALALSLVPVGATGDSNTPSEAETTQATNQINGGKTPQYYQYNEKNDEFANTGDGQAEVYNNNSKNPNVTISKEIKATGTENQFDVTLTVETDEAIETSTAQPDAAIVLVIDVSNSMGYCAECGRGNYHDEYCTYHGWVSETQTRLYAAQEAAKEFLKSYAGFEGEKYKNPGAARYVSIVTFAGSASTVNFGQWWNSTTWFDLHGENEEATRSNLETVEGKIDNLDLASSTNIDAGLWAAEKQLTSNTISGIDNTFVLLLTDGEPNAKTGDSLGNQYQLPDPYPGPDDPEYTRPAKRAMYMRNAQGAEFYSVFFGRNEEMATWMRSFSDEFREAEDSDELHLAFQDIIFRLMLTVDAWKVTDPMGTYIDYEGVDQEGSHADKAISFANNTLTWDLRADLRGSATEIKDSDGNKISYDDYEPGMDCTITYSLTYRISLDVAAMVEENEPFDTNGVSGYVLTNGPTKLDYYLTKTKDGESIYVDDDGNPIASGENPMLTMYFKVPKVRGYVGNLEFTKIGSDTSEALARATFALTGTGWSAPSVTTGTDGKVSFSEIPSGATYTLQETATPEGYQKHGDIEITVAYGQVSYPENTFSGGNGNPLTLVNQADAGSVTIKYVNEDNQEIQESSTQTGKIGDQYEFGVGAGEEIPFTIPDSENGNQQYVFGYIKEGAESLTGVYSETDQTITAVYLLDSNQDNVPDEYQATVTYKIEGGTWSNNEAEIQQVYSFNQFDESTQTWVPVNPAPTLQDIPDVNAVTPDAQHIKDGTWDTTPEEGSALEQNKTYLYTYTLKKTEPSITVTKVAQEDTVKVGEEIHYTVTVTNNGNVDLTNVVVKDTLWTNGNTVSVKVGEAVANYTVEDGAITIETLGKNTVATITYSYTATSVGTVTNEVTADSDQTDLTDPVKEETTVTEADNPAISITKTASVKGLELKEGDTVDVGDTITYTLKVENTGNTSFDTVTVTDTMWTSGKVTQITQKIGDTEYLTNLPENGIWTIVPRVTDDPTFDPGETWTCTYTYTVQDGDTTIENTATVSTTDGGPDGSDTITIPVTGYDLSIDKVLTSVNGDPYQEGSKVRPGDVLTYTINVTNNNEETVTSFTVSDNLWQENQVETITIGAATADVTGGSYLFQGTLYQGDTWTCTYDYTVPEDVASVSNTAVIDLPGDNDPDDTVTVEVEPDAPGLKVEKSLSQVNGSDYTGGKVSVGDKLTYTIQVTNTGNTTLSGVTVEDSLWNDGDAIQVDGQLAYVADGGTYTIKHDIASGDTVTITYTYTVLRSDAGDTLTNTATVTTDGGTTGEDTTETPVKPVTPIRPPVDPDKPELNTEDHYAYIVGYEDGSVQPEGDITRAEVATIFFRLLTDESRNEFWSQTNDYTDVPADAWYNNAVSTLSNAGIIDGYEDAPLSPTATSTRAEFATIAVRFFEATYDGGDLFSDIAGHWAQDYINNEAANAGIVDGYPDGTFRPQQYITRAEAMTMVNRTIDRHPDADHLLDDMIVWPDNPETAWYYEQVQEATNSHEYTMNTDDEQNPYEIWTELLPNRDWSELEKEWSDANDGAGSGEVV